MGLRAVTETRQQPAARGSHFPPRLFILIRKRIEQISIPAKQQEAYNRILVLSQFTGKTLKFLVTVTN
jgi:hypothetical protein